SRVFDPVVVTGRTCGLTGSPTSDYGLYALKDGRLVPVPVQIDEKNTDGKFVLTKGKNRSTDSDSGRFDENDELVFMAADTGDRLSDKALLPQGARAWAELEVTDPATGKKAWAYLAAFNGRPPEKSPIDYVSYDDDPASFSTRNYSGRFDNDHPVGASRYAFEKGVGGNGDDFIDRIKIRLTMRSMGVTLHRSEEDIKVKELGHIDGPVRAVVYSENATPLVLSIGSINTRQYTYYYDSYADFAFAAAFPLRPSLFRATVIDDFKDAKGWTFYNSNNPGGHVIDGKMDDADRKLNLSPWTWGALTNGEQCFWSVWTAPAGCPVKASLYFNDDAEAEDEMEDDKGELPGIGFDFNTGWDQFTEDSVELRLIHFYTRAYRKGMEKDVRNVFDAPLKVTAAAL
ncbi:MAG: hypothetical protein ACOZBW_02025, partial [Thermodesulfobacteriota bacterium]